MNLFWKTLWEEEKTLVTSIFSSSEKVFYLSLSNVCGTFNYLPYNKIPTFHDLKEEGFENKFGKDETSIFSFSCSLF